MTNGMTMSVNDTWSMDVTLTNFKIDKAAKKFDATFEFIIFDHYGLDPADIDCRDYPNQEAKFFCDWEGFLAWFVLQHYELYGFRTSITKIKFSKTIKDVKF